MKQDYLKGVTTLTYDCDKCIGCGQCAVVCPHGVFEMRDKKANVVDKDRCMECGACKMNCPSSAIDLKPGVGCAAAIIGGMLGIKGGCCG